MASTEGQVGRALGNGIGIGVSVFVATKEVDTLIPGWREMVIQQHDPRAIGFSLAIYIINFVGFRWFGGNAGALVEMSGNDIKNIRRNSRRESF